MSTVNLIIEAFLMGLTRFLTGAVVQYRGFQFEPAAQSIFYANHTSHLDTLLIWASIPQRYRRSVRPVAAKDYWWVSPSRRYFAEKIFRAVPVPRQRDAKSADPLHEVDGALAGGDSLIFFPEGTRGDGVNVQPFKSGLHHLMTKHPAVTLVPVYINNLNRVLPKGELIPVPVLCTVTFGAGIYFDSHETRADFAVRARAALEALAVE